MKFDNIKDAPFTTLLLWIPTALYPTLIVNVTSFFFFLNGDLNKH